MQWASTVKLTDAAEDLVELYDCVRCDVVRVNDGTGAPPFLRERRPAHATLPMRSSGFVYRRLPDARKLEA